MTEQEPSGSVEEQLVRAVRDLWSMVLESGESHVIFMDRRRLRTRVECIDGSYHVSWEEEDGSWTAYDRTFDNPREAAFHGYQGPH
jgi:hypothetical protein